jgi:F420-dependent oxidoreductase-like protein
MPYFKYPGGGEAIRPRLAEIARVADQGGFYSFWVMDHFFQISGYGPAEDPMLESYTTLGYIAGVTEQIRLGTMVSGANYRHPGILVKTVTTLDVLSGGRAYFGVGAGWYEREATGLDLPFETFGRRFEWLEETLQIAHQMWTGERGGGAFEGKHFQLREMLNSPQALSRPHPTLLIGGMGRTKTLRMVAQYADACNFFEGRGLDALQETIDALKAHCEGQGRDYAEIEKTSLGTVHLAPGEMSAGQVIDRIGKLAEMGFQQAIFNMPNAHEMAPLEVFAKEIIPAVEKL